MFLGIDVGTSSVKAVLIDEAGALIGSESSPLAISRPHPLWSEQDPDDWWRAVEDAVGRLLVSQGRDGLAAVGLSGQMHGATLLGADDRPLRPAILWNDGRAHQECALLEEREPRSRTITGNLAMPGFTAPKLLWVARHEPDVFRKTVRVLLPKDYVRLRMTGAHASDMSDAAGTLWLDVGQRGWSEAMLAACSLDPSHMAQTFEGPDVTGYLRPEVADAWGVPQVPVVAGGGDNAAGAVGSGCVSPGDAFISLGTSGVYFVVTERFRPNPERAVHAFCHALPGTWHQMAVMLSAASCLSWASKALGAKDEAALLAEVPPEGSAAERGLFFLPYLSGERTPHNDPHARGAFAGLGHETARGDLALAVLEGVALAFRDGQDAMLEGGSKIGDVSLIGGGARSDRWAGIIASALGRPVERREGAEVGPALGAARLARLGVTGMALDKAAPKGAVMARFEPDPAATEAFEAALPAFRRLYRVGRL